MANFFYKCFTKKNANIFSSKTYGNKYLIAKENIISRDHKYIQYNIYYSINSLFILFNRIYLNFLQLEEKYGLNVKIRK